MAASNAKNKTKTFVDLFRSSSFAQYDPKIPRVYTMSKHSLPPSGAPADKTTKRPAFFGFKKDLPPTYYGRSLEYVQVKNLDGDYSQCELTTSERRVQEHYTMSELQRLMAETEALQKNPVPDKKILVPGRILNRLGHGSYAVSVGGIVAHLPATEFQVSSMFANADVARKRCFYFKLKEVSYGNDRKPRVVLSLP